MKIIILSGQDNCGKTTCLTKLHDLLASEIVSEVKQQQGNRNANDYDYVIKLHDGKTIVISTWGDYSTLIQKNCEKYSYCDALICVCNIKFMRSKYKPFEQALLFDPFTTILLKAPEADALKQKESNTLYAETLLKIMRLREII